MASDQPSKPIQGQPAQQQVDPVSLEQVQPAPASETDPEYPPQAFMKMAVFEQKSMSGPLPPASEVAEYNQVIPNGAERIMVMAEKEQQARLDEVKRAQKLDRKALNGYNFRMAFSPIAAFVLTGAAFSLGGYLAINGQPDVAKDIFRITIAAVVSAFLVGKVFPDKKEKGRETN